MYTIEEGILMPWYAQLQISKNWRYVTLEINPSIEDFYIKMCLNKNAFFYVLDIGITRQKLQMATVII